MAALNPGAPAAIAYPAPAKLNLFLHIIGRRADGYHRLQTVFQFLDYGDRLRFSLRDDGQLRMSDALAGVAPTDNLCLRAARLLQKASGCTLGADIRLEKHLPLGGGLGGGSSDAATTLRVLNSLWSLDLPAPRLAELGLSLGADVPVFIHGRAAWAEGVGEQLTPMELPEPWYLVITPDCAVSTREAFADPELRRDAPAVSMDDFRAGRCHNAFEPVVRRRYPQVARALEWLGGHAPARLSGSGASVFAAFPEKTAAQAVLDRVPDGWRKFIARGCNRSPLRVG